MLHPPYSEKLWRRKTQESMDQIRRHLLDAPVQHIGAIQSSTPANGAGAEDPSAAGRLVIPAAVV